MNTDPLSELIAAHIDDVLVDARFPELPGFCVGKVRDNYDLADGRRIVIATDRQSAFDQVLTAVPFKGQVLNQTARSGSTPPGTSSPITCSTIRTPT
jgi:phosphoribosylaminoimidazole-succinocarboxamide synthase